MLIAESERHVIHIIYMYVYIYMCVCVYTEWQIDLKNKIVVNVYKKKNIFNLPQLVKT